MAKDVAKPAVTIWHNAKCATSRKVLGMIRARGIEPVIIAYLKTPPSKSEIKAVLKTAGMRARDLLRRRGTPYDVLGLDDLKLSDAALIAAMSENPILIERPRRAHGQGRAVVPSTGTREGNPLERNCFRLNQLTL
jgi:arsenate reductase (glutaredoxin)